MNPSCNWIDWLTVLTDLTCTCDTQELDAFGGGFLGADQWILFRTVLYIDVAN